MKKSLVLLFLACFIPMISQSNELESFEEDPISKTPRKKVLPKIPKKKVPPKLPRKNPAKFEAKTLEKIKRSLRTLKKADYPSKKYTKQVTFLESHLYNKASFKTLTLLSNLYKDNKDYENQIKVLKLLVLSHPKDARAHYQLGVAYRDLSLNPLFNKDRDKNKANAISYLSDSIKINRNYSQAYEQLLTLLKEKDKHTDHSLALAIEMVRYLKKPAHYVNLCEAYFDNKFFNQSLTTCKKSMKKNHPHPKSHALYILSQQDENQKKKKMIALAKKYKKSFYIQYQTALYFKKTQAPLAISYLEKAIQIQPDSLKTLKLLAQMLFKEKRYEKSYPYFLQACLLSRGNFFKEFEAAKYKIRYKVKSLAPLFKKGVEECFQSSQSKKT